MTSDASDLYEPLMRSVGGDVLGNQRHYAIQAPGGPFTVEGYDGAFLDVVFMDVVVGAGAAILAKSLVGIGGPTLVHFCLGARGDCLVESPDEGRELVHADE